MRSQSRPMAKISPMRGGFGSSLAQRRLRPTPIGAVLLAALGLRSASPHSAAFAPAVQRSLGGQLNFRHWAAVLVKERKEGHYGQMSKMW
jgi:hypothetical protein